VTASGEAAGAALALERAVKRFGPNAAVNDVTLTIETGAVFGLIGPNGAGKTTTFSMLAGYLRPTSGVVRVLDTAPTEVERLRGRIGVLPQDALLPASDTVGEFLIHAARLQEIPPRKALDSAQRALEEVAGGSWWRERCGRLSHGMAKRVALAQAFLGDPEVVLLDEPTAGLDPRVAWEVRQIVKSKKGACTIVVSSHNLQELEEVCDAAAILDRGKLVASGSMAELTATNQEIRVTFGVGTSRGSQPGQVPIETLRELGAVRTVDFDETTLELAVSFDPKQADAEAVIGRILRVLLDREVRIAGVTKGRGLEQRVMDLT
jgi:ABC-type multidrug transport system ATPase subunit